MTIPEAWRSRVGCKSNRAEDIQCMFGVATCGYTDIQATLPNGVSDEPPFPPRSSSTCTPTSYSPAPWLSTNCTSRSSLASGSHNRTRGCNFRSFAIPPSCSRSSSHTCAPAGSLIGASPNIAVSSAETAANVRGGASTRRCAMPCAAFGCTVIDFGRVGT